MDRHCRGLNSPALTIQRFNESLGEGVNGATGMSDMAGGVGSRPERSVSGRALRAQSRYKEEAL